MTIGELKDIIANYPNDAKIVMRVGGDGAIHEGDLKDVIWSDWDGGLVLSSE